MNQMMDAVFMFSDKIGITSLVAVMNICGQAIKYHSPSPELHIRHEGYLRMFAVSMPSSSRPANNQFCCLLNGGLPCCPYRDPDRYHGSLELNVPYGLWVVYPAVQLRRAELERFACIFF
jgi:hypothetical protein